MSTGVLQIDLGLKMRIYVRCWLHVISDYTSAQDENNTRRARHKQYTHTGIAYAHLTESHTCDCIGYVHHIGHAARNSSKKAKNN